VRAIVRSAAADDYRFSALILGIAESDAFRMKQIQAPEELELKRTLAQTLVHDLKNPLAAVLGNLDLLERRADPLLGAVVARTREGAMRMLKMVVNLLDIERLEEGRLEPSLERVDLAELAADTVRDADGAARPKRVRIECLADAPAWAELDASLIRRVLDNLISNAVTHTPRNGRVRIAVEARDGAIEMSVSDQGSGVPEAYRERIFEKYAQLDVRRSGGPANLGLGLTFCRLAVEAHGGTVWVDDAPEGGASFHAVLPADVTPATRSDADMAISA